jgi:hypothetical protein
MGGKKILDRILEKHTSSIVISKPLQEKPMPCFEESSSAKSNPVPSPSIDSSVRPSPEPQAPKERVLLYPSDFPIEFDDFWNTSNHSWHKKATTPSLSHPSNPSEKALPRKEPPKELLMEVKCSSEAIRIRSPSTTIPCSIKGTVVEALHDPIVKASIMSEFQVKTLLDDMPLALTDRLFTSPMGLIFECREIATAVPITIEKTEVR